MDDKIRVLRVNPWKREVTEHRIRNQIYEFHKLIGGYVDMVRLAEEADLWICIFVDDEGLLKDPVAPRWRVFPYRGTLVGYGVVTAADKEGESVSLPDHFTPRYFWDHYHPTFEPWEQRLDPADFPEHVI